MAAAVPVTPTRRAAKRRESQEPFAPSRGVPVAGTPLSFYRRGGDWGTVFRDDRRTPRGVPHVNAPLADLTLPVGRVLCDYLA